MKKCNFAKSDKDAGDKEHQKRIEDTGISERVFREICEGAEKYNVSRVILFGSRARGTHQKKSDLDLAVYGCSNFAEFSFAMQEDVWTLLKMDLIDMDEVTSKDLTSEIERDGVVIYEKV